ncbi:MAG TPA: M48 family peptidase, partial [Thermodesulfovibrionia bacterium]|nr:M48 family peptidase [Thermodesulfovibrionia bacterium]
METYKLILLFTYLAILLFNYYLDYLNIRHVKNNIDLIPPEFKGHIDEELLKKSQNYLIDNTKFDFVASVFNNVLFLAFIFGGILDWYNSWIRSLNLSFIVSGIVFFLLLTYAETFFTLPFSLYHTFRIEKKYGFNTMTFRLWVSDLVKSLVISTVLMLIVLAA